MRSALLHVIVPFVLCVALVNTSLFNDVKLDLSYDHYAERKVDSLPSFLAMPCNSLVNVGYFYLGFYWLLIYSGDEETQHGQYMRNVFAIMAIFYAPVQWLRLAALTRAPAVLDQWVTLPIFAWVPVWIGFIQRGSLGWQAATLELLSLSSYGLSLFHDQGFEVALGGHVALAVYKAVRVQRELGDGRTRVHLLLAVLSCAGFVVLKLLDLRLSSYWLFQRLTGHFWSKVCDVLQFHFSFCFLTTLTRRARKRAASPTGQKKKLLLPHPF